MYLLRKIQTAALRVIKALAEQFEPASPADREIEQNRRQLATERARKTAR